MRLATALTLLGCQRAAAVPTCLGRPVGYIGADVFHPVTVNGLTYEIDGTSSTLKFGAPDSVSLSVPATHPIRVHSAGCAPVLTGGTAVASGPHIYRHGPLLLRIPAPCAGPQLSLESAHHGAMGGAGRLQYDSECTPNTGSAPLCATGDPLFDRWMDGWWSARRMRC